MIARGKAPPHIAAGMLLRGFVEHEQINGQADAQKTKRVIAKVRELLEEAERRGITKSEPHMILAIKMAADAIERKVANPEADVSTELSLFTAAVENHRGGPRDIDLGGHKVKNKHSANECHARAAAVVLWKEYPDERDQLVKEAKKLMGTKDKKALAKLVENHDQKHLDPKKPSTLSPHLETIHRQIRATRRKSLADFFVP